MDTRNKFLPRDEPIEIAHKRITKRIRNIRRQQKVTQKEMAEALMITERSYSDKENPLKSPEFKLSEILSISKKLQVMPGLIVADYWNPEIVGKMMLIVQSLREIEPAVNFCHQTWEEAGAFAESRKVNQAAIHAAKRNS